MTRPKFPDGKAKTEMLRVRMTKVEFDLLKMLSGGKMSEYVRKKIFPKGVDKTS